MSKYSNINCDTDTIPDNFKIGCLVRLQSGVTPLDLKLNQIYKVENISEDGYRFKIFGLSKNYSPAFEVLPEELNNFSISEVSKALEIANI